jgi:hypothetical protein
MLLGVGTPPRRQQPASIRGEAAPSSIDGRNFNWANLYQGAVARFVAANDDSGNKRCRARLQGISRLLIALARRGRIMH